MNSIEQRIGSGLALSLLLTLLVLALLAEVGVQRLSRDFVATGMEHDGDSLIRALELGPEGRWRLDERYLPPIYQRVQSGHYFQVRGVDQTLRSRSLWDRAPPVPSLEPGQTRRGEYRSGGEHWLTWSRGIELQGQPLVLWMAEELNPLEAQWRRFSWLLYGVMGVSFALLLWLQRHLLGRSFRQVARVEEAVRQLQQGHIEALSEQVPRELRPLTAEINRLLLRLEQRIGRSRTAMGNLAHELKRSLQQLHLLRDALPEGQRPACDRVLTEMGQLVERELRRARIAGTPHPGRHFAPAEDLPHLVAVLSRVYPAITLDTELDDGNSLPYDRDDMLELIGNLLDNGCKYARSRVRLRFTVRMEEVRLEIADDGPGVDAEALDQLTERGVRVDESVDGHGLGLSICRMIIDSYGGRLAFDAGEAGYPGLRVTVSLPRAPASPDVKQKDTP